VNKVVYKITVNQSCSVFEKNEMNPVMCSRSEWICLWNGWTK